MAVGEEEGTHGSGWETREKETTWGDNIKMEVKRVQWNLDLSFFKGTEKTNDECRQTINPENYYTM